MERAGRHLAPSLNGEPQVLIAEGRENGVPVPCAELTAGAQAWARQGAEPMSPSQVWQVGTRSVTATISGQ
jgi:hypothetical protein